MKLEGRTTLILAALLVISFSALLAVTIIVPNAAWGGTDDQGMELVEHNLAYKAWMKPIWEPPSGEIESLLFALQAAIGSVIIGYYLGLLKGRKEKESER